jgi:hypothetical protein
MEDTMREGAGLAGACARDDEKRSVFVYCRLALLFVQVFEVFHRGMPSQNNLCAIIQKFWLRFRKNPSKYTYIPQYFSFSSLKIFEFFAQELFSDCITAA